MTRSHRLVIFDLDGTLIATAGEICDAVNDALRSSGLPGVTQEQVEGWIGHGTSELLVQAVAFVLHSEASGVRQSDTLKRVAAEFDQSYPGRCGTRSHPYPDAPEVLEDLRAAGFKLALLTNKEARYASRILAVHHLEQAFDKLVFGDSVTARKPDPQGIQLCLSDLGTDRHRALLVGDSWIDVATARNAGIAVWAMPHGYNEGKAIAASNPDRVIDGFGALRDALLASGPPL